MENAIYLYHYLRYVAYSERVRQEYQFRKSGAGYCIADCGYYRGKRYIYRNTRA